MIIASTTRYSCVIKRLTYSIFILLLFAEKLMLSNICIVNDIPCSSSRTHETRQLIANNTSRFAMQICAIDVYVYNVEI